MLFRTVSSGVGSSSCGRPRLSAMQGVINGSALRMTQMMNDLRHNYPGEHIGISNGISTDRDDIVSVDLRFCPGAR
jgi:hypothetical protein